MHDNKTEKKNLLIYAHYYIPDTASTGQILSELWRDVDKFITIICVVKLLQNWIKSRNIMKKKLMV